MVYKITNLWGHRHVLFINIFVSECLKLVLQLLNHGLNVIFSYTINDILFVNYNHFYFTLWWFYSTSLL